MCTYILWIQIAFINRSQGLNFLQKIQIQCLFQKLQRIQNCAARLVAQLPKAALIPVLFSRNYIGCLSSRGLYLRFCYSLTKALNNLAPVYISNLLVRYEPSRNLRSTDKYLLRIPQTHLKTYGDRAFSVAASRLWNALPMDIKLSPSVSVFKNRRKTHLFRVTYY